MNAVRVLLLSFFLLLAFSGCEEKNASDLHTIHWDRDMCERCKMVVSDRKHTVQLIDTTKGRAYMFDDIGCLSLWTKDNNITWLPRAKVWITDVNSGKWIDAKNAYYEGEHLTPMAYGIAAYESRDGLKNRDNNLTFGEVMHLIVEIESQKIGRTIE